MLQYKYTVELSYLDVATSTSKQILNASIKTVVIDYNYAEYNMPIMMMTLSLDKNLVDDMVNNIHTNLFNITISKIIINTDDQAPVTYIKGQFNYFMNKDINYNKNIDYNDDNKNTDGTTKTDVFTDVMIGFMSKSAIDNNKKISNFTVYNTSMRSIVGMITKHMPILIEPFSYNTQIAQIILPPMGSISKALAYLNNISVFYETSYRYFIDYDLAYIISSSGKAVAKKDELYTTVTVDVKAVEEYDSENPGMFIDTVNKCYTIPISSADTRYYVNSTIAKTFNSITAILDNSKKIADSKPKDINNILSTINGCVSKIKAATSLISSKIANVSNTVERMKYTVKEDINKTAVVAIRVGEINLQISNILNGANVSATVRDAMLADTITNATKIQNSYNSISQLPNVYPGIGDKMVLNMYDTKMAVSLVGGVTPINVQDNVSSLKTTCTSCKNDSAGCKSDVNTVLLPANDHIVNIDTCMGNMYTSVCNMPTTVSVNGTDPITGADCVTEADISAIQAYAPELKEMCITTSEVKNRTCTDIISIQGTPDLVDSSLDSLACETDTLSCVSSLKQEYTNTGDSITVSGGAITNPAAMPSIQLLGGTNIASIASNISSTLIKNITTNLNSIKDISLVGCLGLSKIDIDMDIEKEYNAITKTKLMRMPNDNINLAKNIKSDVELGRIQFSINKNDIDSSVMTPNKEYIVKNYDGQCKKDGKFLLSRKRELFIREDEKFVMNTMLDFRQLKSTNA